jgi:hypothetical protein
LGGFSVPGSGGFSTDGPGGFSTDGPGGLSAEGSGGFSAEDSARLSPFFGGTSWRMSENSALLRYGECVRLSTGVTVTLAIVKMPWKAGFLLNKKCQKSDSGGFCAEGPGGCSGAGSGGFSLGDSDGFTAGASGDFSGSFSGGFSGGGADGDVSVSVVSRVNGSFSCGESYRARTV